MSLLRLRWALVFATFGSIRCRNFDVLDKTVFPKLPVAPLNSKNELCAKESAVYFDHLNNLTLWAHKMWDATAKSTTGTLQGSSYQMGDWDECMKSNGPFRPQFCFAIITANVDSLKPPKDPFTLRYDPMESILRRIYRTHDISQQMRGTVRMGWCVPASCDSQDLEDHLDDYLSRGPDLLLGNGNVSYVAKVPGLLCQRKDEEKPLETSDIIFCTITAVFIILVTASTIYDYNKEHTMTEKEKLHLNRMLSHRLIMAFSARKNFLELSRADDSNPALSILYGLRTVAIFVIIMDHRFGTFTSGPIINFDYIEEQYRSVAGWFFFHGDVFVDTFFLLSGILVTYGLMAQYEKRLVNPAFFILLRYTRLTPVYAYVIFYYVTIFNYIGSGPQWKAIVGGESTDCRNNWWTNLLYVNNYVNDDHMCMTQSWYLACDLHYFIIAVFLILLMKKNKKLAIGIFLLLSVVSMVVPFVITIVYLRPALLRFFPDFLIRPKIHTDFRLTYIKTHTRASAYCVGMVGGYIYYKLKDEGKELSKLKSHSLAFVSIVLLFVGMASGAVFYDPYHAYDPIESAFYAALHRPTWAIGSLGLLFSASHGYTTIVQRALSWSPFVPLSKLVYGAYLMHMSFQFRALAMTIAPQYFDYFSLISLSIGDITMSFISALILYIIIEAPVRKIFRELLVPHRKHPPVAGEHESRGATTNSSNGTDCNSRL